MTVGFLPLPPVEPSLDQYRKNALHPEPEAFLAHFPGGFVQYFDDSPRHETRIARSAAHFDRTLALRKQVEGCGVYFSPNAFVGARRIECLRRIQAVFLDIDHGKQGDGQATIDLERKKVESLSTLLENRHPPHAIVETKHGLQPIWKVRPLDPGPGLRLFRPAMERLLASFGGDPGAKDPTRVLRLPGFFHLKDPSMPFPCLLLWEDLGRRPEELKAILDDLEVPRVRPRVFPEPMRPRYPTSFEVPDVADVIVTAAAEAGISVGFRRNRDGSRQIIEDGEVTSGFISGRGNFCHSSSGKRRRGGPIQLVQFYLGLDRDEARAWLQARFAGFGWGIRGSPRPRGEGRPSPDSLLRPEGRASPAASRPDSLARGPNPAIPPSAPPPRDMPSPHAP